MSRLDRIRIYAIICSVESKSCILHYSQRINCDARTIQNHSLKVSLKTQLTAQWRLVLAVRSISAVSMLSIISSVSPTHPGSRPSRGSLSPAAAVSLLLIISAHRTMLHAPTVDRVDSGVGWSGYAIMI